ncbi:MAG TPA: hypothetical protein VH281_04020 [Gaiellaceae bacterium]
MVSRALLAAALLALGLLTGCGSTSTAPETDTVTKTVTVPARTEPVAAPPHSTAARAPVSKPDPAPPSKRLEFGHIGKLARSGDGFELRFDPAEYITGVTAAVAALEDTGSSDVPNDSYVVDESHRLYTYLVPADAHVTVLAGGVNGTSITVAQLAKIVHGKDPLGHPLFEPLDTGVWIRVVIDTVGAIDQQYVP